MPSPPTSGWDTRAWVFGITSGLTLGGLLFVLLNPATLRNLDAVFGKGSGITIGTSVFLGSLLLLPGITSGLARRRLFWWGLLPAVILDLWLTDRTAHRPGAAITSTDFWEMQAVVGGAWLISSGPVAFVRWQMRLHQKRRARAQAVLAAHQSASAVPQEGVWPPPPAANPAARAPEDT